MCRRTAGLPIAESALSITGVLDIGHENGLMCGVSRHMIYGCLCFQLNEHGRLIAFRKPTVCLLAQAMSVRPINEFP